MLSTGALPRITAIVELSTSVPLVME